VSLEDDYYRATFQTRRYTLREWGNAAATSARLCGASVVTTSPFNTASTEVQARRGLSIQPLTRRIPSSEHISSKWPRVTEQQSNSVYVRTCRARTIASCTSTAKTYEPDIADVQSLDRASGIEIETRPIVASESPRRETVTPNDLVDESYRRAGFTWLAHSGLQGVRRVPPVARTHGYRQFSPHLHTSVFSSRWSLNCATIPTSIGPQYQTLLGSWPIDSQ
jgi:hypothetical protein